MPKSSFLKRYKNHRADSIAKLRRVEEVIQPFRNMLNRPHWDLTLNHVVS